MKVHALPLLAVVLLIAAVMLCGGCREAIKNGEVNSLGESIPKVTPLPAAPTTPVLKPGDEIIMTYWNNAKQFQDVEAKVVEYGKIVPDAAQLAKLPKALDPELHTEPGFRLKRDNFWLYWLGSANLQADGTITYNPADIELVEMGGNDTSGTALARYYLSLINSSQKTAGQRVTPPVGNDGPELTLYGPITGLTPIKGKKGHYKLEVDVQTDNPELVKTVVLGKTRINGLVSN